MNLLELNYMLKVMPMFPGKNTSVFVDALKEQIKAYLECNNQNNVKENG